MDRHSKAIEKLHLASDVRDIPSFLSNLEELQENMDERAQNSIANGRFRYEDLNQFTFFKTPVPIELCPAAEFLRFAWPDDTRRLWELALYQAYQSQDMSVLANGLFSYGRLEFEATGRSGSGCDHCSLLRYAIDAMASNDLILMRRMLPKAFGFSTNGHRISKAGCNLLMALIHDDALWKEKALTGARKLLQQKISLFDQSFIIYLITMIENDGAKSSDMLNEMARLYLKQTSIHEFHSPYLKIFSPLLHGLHHLAYHFLTSGEFAKLVEPDHPAFWKKYTAYQREAGFKSGMPLIQFTGTLEGLNGIYTMR